MLVETHERINWLEFALLNNWCLNPLLHEFTVLPTRYVTIIIPTFAENNWKKETKIIIKYRAFRYFARFIITSRSRLQYGWLSFKIAVCRYSYCKQFPHHVFLKQTDSGFKTKHFVWTTLKNNLPIEFASSVSAIFKHDRNLKIREISIELFNFNSLCPFNRIVCTFCRTNNASTCSTSNWINCIFSPYWQSNKGTSCRARDSIYRRYQNRPNDCIFAPTILCRTILFPVLLINRKNPIFKQKPSQKWEKTFKSGLYRTTKRQFIGKEIDTYNVDSLGNSPSKGARFADLLSSTVRFVLWSFLSLDIFLQSCFSRLKCNHMANSLGNRTCVSSRVTLRRVDSNSALKVFTNLPDLRLPFWVMQCNNKPFLSYIKCSVCLPFVIWRALYAIFLGENKRNEKILDYSI